VKVPDVWQVVQETFACPPTSGNAAGWLNSAGFHAVG
jgi:hypothetical protein